MHLIDGGWFWGMHLFWWVFWFLIIGTFFSLLTPVPRHKVRETPYKSSSADTQPAKSLPRSTNNASGACSATRRQQRPNRK
jgi:hypothetical protein